MATITVAPLVGSRNQARKLLAGLSESDRSGLTIECTQMSLGTPSFIDEIIKIVLFERGFEWLRLLDPPQATRKYAIESAETFGVSGRLIFD